MLLIPESVGVLANHNLPLVRSEPGVEAFYLTARQDDPNTLVFYEIYRSQASQEFHLDRKSVV